MTVINQTTCRLFSEVGQTTQLTAYYEEGRRTLWMMLRAQSHPSFNHGLIEEIMNLSYAAQCSGLPIDFWVTGSLVPTRFNAGATCDFLLNQLKTANVKHSAPMPEPALTAFMQQREDLIPGQFPLRWSKAVRWATATIARTSVCSSSR